MSTTRFSENIIEASTRIQDARTDATAAGDSSPLKRYSSVQWSRYENNSLRDILLEEFTKSADTFENKFPFYVKTGVALTPAYTSSTGVIARPSDVFVIIDLQTDGGVNILRLRPDEIQDVKLGIDPINVASPTHPYYYEEQGNIITLGLTTGNIIPRYVSIHQDIAPSNASPGSGKMNSAGGSYVASTQVLTIAMTGNFVAGTDENKRIMIFDTNATKVYYGRIASIPTIGTAVLSGDNLPSANITGTNVSIALVSDNDITDLTQNFDNMRDEIIKRMLVYAQMDALNSVK